MDQKDKLKIATAFLASGMAFGLIDNGGLMLGMSAIEGEVAKYTTDEKVIAGLGNTYSDVLGSFLGAYVGSDHSEEDRLGWFCCSASMGCSRCRYWMPDSCLHLRYRSLKK